MGSYLTVWRQRGTNRSLKIWRCQTMPDPYGKSSICIINCSRRHVAAMLPDNRIERPSDLGLKSLVYIDSARDPHGFYHSWEEIEVTTVL
ncbi:hypothetical protein BDQ17DRAFT_730169 [Cyathus striatus]|nr:hypothetical protein BDQ17DRAFT_730169 [Cyathus striatus]